MKIKLNTDLNGHKKGETIIIEDMKGVPLDAYWRNRFKDSEFDNCITIIEKEESIEEPKQTKEKKVLKKSKKVV